MFHFIKRGDRSNEKDRKKKEDKKNKKHLSTEDLNRLEEVRRSYFGRRKSAKSKEGTSANVDDTSPVTSPLKESNGGATTTLAAATAATAAAAPASRVRPTLPPKPPPKRGILKGSSQYVPNQGVKGDIDDHLDLVENTMANEVIVYDVLPPRSRSDRPPPPPPKPRSSSGSSEAYSSATQSPMRSVTDVFVSATNGEGVGGDGDHLKTYGVDLPLPKLVIPEPPRTRSLTILRQPGGDFGFCLRRSVADPWTSSSCISSTGTSTSTSSSASKECLFAEPKEFNRNNPTGLLPGDRLLDVNGVSVIDMGREQVANLIRASGESVTLSVRTVPELRELMLRSSVDGGASVELDEGNIRTGSLTRSGSKRFKSSKAKSEVQLASEKAWLDTQKVWLVHKEGYAGAVSMSAASVNGDGSNVAIQAGEGKTQIRLDHNDEIIEVDEEDLEKANPPHFDCVEDLAQLRYLNESSVLHTLRQRFASSLIHTYASSSMLLINPMQPLSIYTEKVMQMFKGCKRDDMPPHVYSVAQSSYRDMLSSRVDQSIVLLGRSGSGKTFNADHVLSYLCHTAGTVNKVLTVEKLRAITTLLEYFGHCRTSLNSNATRFTVIFSLDFDHSGQIANASLQAFMLDKEKVVRLSTETGSPFRVFHLLLAGTDDKLKKELYLDGAAQPNLFFNIPSKSEDVQHAGLHWAKMQGCLDMLGVQEEESKALWSVLAAIYHLGAAGVDTGASGKGQFVNPQSAQRAAVLLGATIEELARFVFSSSVPGSSNHSGPTSRPLYRTSPTDSTDASNQKPADNLDALEGIAMGLYCEVFNALISLMNRSISSGARTISSILVVDTPGFQNPGSCGRQEVPPVAATFSDLCHNYVQERLQLLYHEHAIVAQQDKYTQEHIEYDGGDEMHSDGVGPAAVVNLIDRPSQQGLIRTSNLDLRNADQRGLLWLLDEEAIFPGSSDESFLERLFIHNDGSQRGVSGQHRVLQRSNLQNHIIIQHMLGTNPVLYDAQGWLKSCRENPNVRSAVLLLHDSQKDNISNLFVTCRGPVSMSVSGSVVGIEGASSLRRASSIRRRYTTGTAGIKRKSVCLQVKFQVDGIVETLRRSRLHFIHCLLPQHNVQSRSIAMDFQFNVPLVRSQLRGSQVIDATRMNKQGYPDHVSYAEFRRRFKLLTPVESRQMSPVLDEKKAVEALIEHMDIDKTQYKFGLSQVFFRNGALLQLEEQRDDRLQDTVVRFQAYCRGRLARKKLVKLKVQDVAIRCIQRNVRKFMGVQTWPWWRLLVKVLPLLNVHRTEEELRHKSEELESLKAKFEKLERERNELKHDNNRLEAKVSELTADLADEHATSTHASEMLEAESSERMRLEKDLQGFQTQYVDMQRMHERMEVELMEVRMLRASEMNGDLSGDDDDGDSVYRQRYEGLRREFEYTKKKLQQQLEDDAEQHASVKKSIERKLAEAVDEADQARQGLNQWKRKMQRLSQEMNDLKCVLEEQTVRNAALEKKQRKFDVDLNGAQEEARLERLQKEKILRERDQLMGERYTLEQGIQGLKLDLEMKDEKLGALTRELDDLTFGNKGDEELAQLKRAKHELEVKMKDQEEELDDLAGQLQMLEQAKLRLEMNLENVRKEYRKELSQKEEEIEETRASCQKKLKILEHQLETEHDERQTLIRERHELERKMNDLQERAPQFGHDAETVHRLRKDLKRTKALLRDAQTVLESSRDDAPSKSVIRQLKHQLEDAEFARMAAIKARQGAEMELQEVTTQVEDMSKAKNELEKKVGLLGREKSELLVQVEEGEEELAEVMRKYRSSVSQLSADQLQLSEVTSQVTELETERGVLREQVAELTSRLEQLEGEAGTAMSVGEQRRLELRARELETRLELEATTKTRLESQLARLHDAVEKLNAECDALRNKEQQAVDLGRRLQRQIRELKEDCGVQQQRELEAAQKRRELEMALENADTENQTVRSDLKLALKRIEDLQAAMEDNVDSDASDSESHSSVSSDSSLDAYRPSRMTSSRRTPRSPNSVGAQSRSPID